MSDAPRHQSSSSERPGYRVLRHQLLAKVLELVLTPVDIAVETELQVMSEPPKADILLLRRHGRHWSEAQRQLLPDGVRDRQASHHLLECKFTESCNAAALQQALGYDYFYRQTQQLTAGELQTYVVSAKTMEENAMQKELTVEDVMVIGDKLRKQAIASATPEEMLAVLSPEAVLAVLSPEERLAGLGPEERLAGLAPEELEQLRAAINAQLARQQQAKPQHRRKSGNR